MGETTNSDHRSAFRTAKFGGGGALLAIAAVLFSVIPAAAAEGSVDATLSRLDGAGYAVIDITVSGFSPEANVFVLPCSPPASGDPSDVDAADCRIAATEQLRTDDDGSATRMVAWPVDEDEDAIAVAAGDDLEADLAMTIVVLREAAVLGTAETPAAEAPANEAPAAEPPAAEPTQEPEPVTTDATLPETGDDSLLIALAGAILLAAGSTTAVASRRLHRTVPVYRSVPTRRGW